MRSAAACAHKRHGCLFRHHAAMVEVPTRAAPHPNGVLTQGALCNGMMPNGPVCATCSPPPWQPGRGVACKLRRAQCSLQQAARGPGRSDLPAWALVCPAPVRGGQRNLRGVRQVARPRGCPSHATPQRHTQLGLSVADGPQQRFETSQSCSQTAPLHAAVANWHCHARRRRSTVV